jgi:hypothetical protein
MHVGFTTDEGGNTIDLRWYRHKSNLHHVSVHLIAVAAYKRNNQIVVNLARTKTMLLMFSSCLLKLKMIIRIVYTGMGSRDFTSSSA